MKKSTLLILIISGSLSLKAQDVILENLPGMMQDFILDEEKEFICDNSADTFYVNSAEGYYKGLKRTVSSDTIYFYDWDRHDAAWRNHHRIVKQYDASENLISSLLQVWVRPGVWENGALKEFSYEINGLDEVVVRVWIRRIQDWQNFLKKDFVYNSEGQVEEITGMRWYYPAQAWVNKDRKILEYTLDGKLAADTLYAWRPMIQTWQYTGLREWTYDANGYPDIMVASRWDPQVVDWMEWFRLDNDADASGLVQLRTFQHWNPQVGDWINSRQIEFFYNGEGVLIERIMRLWHVPVADWVDEVRHLFTYDQDGQLDTMLTQHWVPYLMDWQDRILDDFAYGADGSLQSRLTQLWNPWAGDWVNFRLMELVVDLKNLVAGIDPLNLEGSNRLTIEYSNPYNPVYPLTVRGQDGLMLQLDVYSISGLKVTGQEISTNQPVYLGNDLASGLYILSARGEGKQVTAKILIAH